VIDLIDFNHESIHDIMSHELEMRMSDPARISSVSADNGTTAQYYSYVQFESCRDK
jgi:hypothetical protein